MAALNPSRPQSGGRSSGLRSSAFRSPGSLSRGAVSDRASHRRRLGARRVRGRARSRGAGAARGARRSLRRFRQASVLALALTGLIFLLLGLEEADVVEPAVDVEEPAAGVESVSAEGPAVGVGAASADGPAVGVGAASADGPAVGVGAASADGPVTVASVSAGPPPRDSPAQVGQEGDPADTLPPVEPAQLLGEAVGQARVTAIELRNAFLGNLPRWLVAVGILVLAWGVTRLLRPVMRRALGQWERAQAFTALTGVVVWLVALGVAVSVLVGDVRALVGSLGLVGLALSWALQNPIESFTGWLMNGMRGYYRVGDRIAVGEILGDVFRIDFFTTTVWEIGGPDRPGQFVQAEQATGRLITFPNNEVLTGSIVNYTRDFAWVWDELAVGVANESDVSYAMRVLQEVAERELGEAMAGPAAEYESILRARRLETSVPRGPQVFVSYTESWTDVVVRYLVDARSRRVWKSRLSLAVHDALNAPEHAGRILPVYPRRQVMLIGPDGKGVEPEGGG